MIGVCPDTSQNAGEDIDMENAAASKSKTISGSAELNYVRDNMALRPLFSSVGESKTHYIFQSIIN